MTEFANILPGDPAPHFIQRSFANPTYTFDRAAGRHILLCFFLAAGDPHSAAALKAVRARTDLFDDENIAFFGVSTDPADDTEKRVADFYPGFRFFFDFDLKISKLYGAAPLDTPPEQRPFTGRRFWLLIDPTLRVKALVPFKPDQSDIAEILATLEDLPPPGQHTGIELHAPVLFLPNVFEPAFCEKLIELYETGGAEESGFMREIDGKTVSVSDHSTKRRRDHSIEDKEVIAFTQNRIKRRVVPEIAKVHQFIVTRMERYIVACYTAEDGGHFIAHRDNTTKGTAHRRFAVSINLNDDFEGGEVSFPEYGRRQYKPPPGGAVVFSCSLLHQVSKVTRGKRYCFLPFLYDDEAAKIREANNRYLGEGVGEYKSTG